MDYVGVPEDRGPTMDAKSSSMRERERVSKAFIIVRTLNRGPVIF